MTDLNHRQPTRGVCGGLVKERRRGSRTASPATADDIRVDRIAVELEDDHGPRARAYDDQKQRWGASSKE